MRASGTRIIPDQIANREIGVPGNTVTGPSLCKAGSKLEAHSQKLLRYRRQECTDNDAGATRAALLMGLRYFWPKVKITPVLRRKLFSLLFTALAN